jgi:hypothetical protein
MAHPTYTAAAKQMIDARAAARQYRANASRLRALGRKELGRNGGATGAAIFRREQERKRIYLALLLAGHGELAWCLNHEHLAYARRDRWGTEQGREDVRLARAGVRLHLPL